MIVKLYELPPIDESLAACRREGIDIRRARPPERPRLLEWIGEHYGFWSSEVERCFGHTPVSCHIAVRDGAVVGFSCHDAFAPNFFGPTGVAADAQGRGIGTALLLVALHDQRAQGYAYSIIGGVGPTEFYERSVGAIVIPGSDPGPYANLLV